MKKRALVLVGVFALALTFGLSLSSCATTNVATTKRTDFSKKPISLPGMPAYTILGTVFMEKKWFGVLGMTTPQFGPIPRVDYYIYQSGGITYVELLEEAKKQYPEADAVVDISVDFQGSHYWFFYSGGKNILSGIVIKYTRAEVGYSPAGVDSRRENGILDILNIHN
jgi:hypothetical protein